MNEAKTLLVIVESYLSRQNHNILVLNYETLSKNFYSVVVENSKEVGMPYLRNSLHRQSLYSNSQLGRRVAHALRNLYYKGLNPDRIHLLGFSLGAHICGEIGRALQPHFKVPR